MFSADELLRNIASVPPGSKSYYVSLKNGKTENCRDKCGQCFFVCNEDRGTSAKTLQTSEKMLLHVLRKQRRIIVRTGDGAEGTQIAVGRGATRKLHEYRKCE
jgi:hypothetical protein